VLYYGCGLGHLYRFLQRRNYYGEYTGLDINENLIAKNKILYPNTKFDIKDIQHDVVDL
jgi:trans-aconitate methyltransferase